MDSHQKKYSRIPLIYIAGPYRNSDPVVKEQNILTARQYGEEIIRLGAAAIVPHNNFRYYDGYAGEQFFLEATLRLMSVCDAVLVIPGYINSEGTKGEIVEARHLGIPIYFNVSDISKFLGVWLEQFPEEYRNGNSKH